jgi:uncharacterized repeat protein (TIGR01451 family)
VVELDASGEIAYAGRSSASVLVYDAIDFFPRHSFIVPLQHLYDVWDMTAAPDRRRLFLIGGNTYGTDQDIWIIAPDLSQSQKSVSARWIEPGQLLTYNIVINNATIDMIDAISVTDSLPLSISLVPSSLSGTAVYFTETRTLSWTGTLSGGVSVSITFQAVVADTIPRGATITNTVWITHSLLGPLSRTVTVVRPFYTYLAMVLRNRP